MVERKKEKFDPGPPVKLSELSALPKRSPERLRRTVVADVLNPPVPSAYRGRAFQPGGVHIAERLAMRMEPGCWYGRPDLAALSGARRKSVDFVIVTMRKQGLVEQGENPDWQPQVYRKGEAIAWDPRARRIPPIAETRREPRYLFRLTPEGIAFRRRCAVLA